MKLKLTAVSIAMVSALAAGSSADAATVTPDKLIIESNRNRGDGLATTDINVIAGDFGLVQGIAGIAGRIVNGIDTFTFRAWRSFDVDFVDLADLAGVDIDGCSGFDGSDCSAGSTNNEDGRTATFTLDNGVDPVSSVRFTSSIAAGTSMFSNVAAGEYTFTIDGISGPAGSAYDIAISVAPPVPVPAGLPLLLSAFGVAGFVARRRKS